MPEITVKLGDTVVQTFAFDKDVFTVGRGKDNDLVLETLSVSRNHFRLRREGGRYVLSDLHSANGTFVNGVKVSKTEVLDGDTISIGKHKLLFALNPEAGEAGILGGGLDAQRTILVDPSQAAQLTVTRGKQQGQTFTVDRYETLIGRAAECPVRIQDWFVGKKHAVIYREGTAFTIRDLGKLAGVSVNETVVRGSCRLNDGDEIKIGPVQMQFRLTASSAGIPAMGRVPVEMPQEASRSFEAPASPVEPSPLPSIPPGAEEADLSDSGLEAEQTPAFVQATPDESPEEASKAVADAGPSADVLAAPQPEAPEPAPAEQPAPPPEAALDPAKAKEIAMWEKALRNDSPAIRREAARRLRKLTGKDYEL